MAKVIRKIILKFTTVIATFLACVSLRHAKPRQCQKHVMRVVNFQGSSLQINWSLERERETSAALGPFPKTWESELIVYTEESILFHDSLAINS